MVEPGAGILPAPPITRFERAHFDEPTAAVYKRALIALEAGSAPWLIGGALALNHYTGVWRHTKDMDVFARPGDVNAILETLAGAGFETQIVYPSWLSKAWRDDLFVDVIHRNANGLHPVEDVWFERAPTGTLLGQQVRFIPVEEMLLSKMFVAGRFRYDGADVCHVIYAAHDKVDWDFLVERAGEHWELLLSNLLVYRYAYPLAADRVPGDVLDALLARLEAARRAGPEALEGWPFRGRLLDLNSFSVDVDAWGLPDPHAEIVHGVLGLSE
jgi:hypothetical protein